MMQLFKLLLSAKKPFNIVRFHAENYHAAFELALAIARRHKAKVLDLGKAR